MYERLDFFFLSVCRIKIENATLRESIESMEQLTSSIHRLRLSLLKVAICLLHHLSYWKNIKSLIMGLKFVTIITFVNLQAKESVTLEGPGTSMLEALKGIINEAKLIKTALSSSLPISWSAEANAGSSEETLHDSHDVLGQGDASLGKIDFVSAAGFEMVELLVSVAELLIKDYKAESGS